MGLLITILLILNKFDNFYLTKKPYLKIFQYLSKQISPDLIINILFKLFILYCFSTNKKGDLKLLEIKSIR